MSIRDKDDEYLDIVLEIGPEHPEWAEVVEECNRRDALPYDGPPVTLGEPVAPPSTVIAYTEE